VKRIVKNIWPYLLLVGLGLGFFGFFLRGGRVLLPADLLVGAYYPWKENKWGYEVSVPYKNPLLSDSYSQFFIWKKLIANSYQQGKWPLWNRFSYSGYPLAGNLHSAAFYPFNFLFAVLPLNSAWNWYLILGSILSSITMYGLIRTLGMSKGAGIVGGMAYGYCGYAISWMEFATATNSMIWIPLLILIIEKYFLNKNIRVLWWLSPVILMLITSGNFQMSIYGAIVLTTYSLYRFKNNWSKLFLIFLFGALGILISSIALLPGLEMLPLSIRNIENSMANINYGLVPLAHLITVVAPDFFGNSATGNYWGTLNYHETLIYGGGAVFLAILWSLFNIKSLSKQAKYFLFLTIISLFFYVDNPLIRLIYQLNIPGLATTTAGRNAYFWILGGGVLVGAMIDNFGKNLKIFGYWFLILLITLLVVVGVRQYYLVQNSPYLTTDIANLMVSIRNLVVPFGLFIGFFLITIIFSKRKFWWVLVLVLMMFDSWRFTKKYLPISESKYVFPRTEITDFLANDKDIFRVEKERGALLSPNTWTMYGLQSPSGYDPFGLALYTEKFNREINGGANGYSRYAEIEKYNAKVLGNYNVKYLVTFVKNKNEAEIIDHKDWDKVYATAKVEIYKNKFFQERIRILNGKIKVMEYDSDKIIVEYETDKNTDLIVLDTWYPGWKALVNGKEIKIDKYDEVFRKVSVENGKGILEMRYDPDIFQLGKTISLVSLAIWVGIVVFYKCLKFKK
jgi:uncharacterized membrane protein YfhO